MTDEQQLPGEDASLWSATTPPTRYRAFKGPAKAFDVAIVGAGLSGLLTAWRLADSGARIAVVDSAQIVQGTTGSTTAKITSQHNLIYDYLIRKHGRDAAAAYARLNQQAVDEIETLVAELRIDCDFERRDAFVYCRSPKEVENVERETEAAASLGLPASLVTETELPFEVAAAERFTDQAQFHPRKFLLALAKQLPDNVSIFANTEVDVIEPARPHKVRTNRGAMKADTVVMAGPRPMYNASWFDRHSWIKQSYVWAARIDGAYPQGMYISSEDPVRSIRSHPYEKGQLLLIGGESHRADEGADMPERYARLQEFARTTFEVEEFVYRWMASDRMPNDRVPFLGGYPKVDRLYAATGFKAWGMAFSQVAAKLISSDILGRPHPEAEVFSLERLR